MPSPPSPPEPPSREWKNTLIPHIVDYLALNAPESIYAEYPISPSTYSLGYHSITYAQLSNAINGIASWLIQNLGKPKREFEVVAYVGPNDLRYAVLILGAVKAGYAMFLTSPRNSLPAQMKLLNGLNCTTILSPNPQTPAIKAILEADTEKKFREFDIPSVEELLETKYDHFPFEKTWDEARDEPLCIVHTSGSTGIPKPMIMTHSTGSMFMSLMNLEGPPGYTSLSTLYNKKRLLVTFPPFHGAYLAYTLMNAIPFGTIIVSPLSNSLPTASGLTEVLKHTKVDIALLVPSVVQELSQNPELLHFWSENLLDKLILYCGGDLPQKIGDIVNTQIRLLNQFGATELGMTAQIIPNERDISDWKYVSFHPDSGIEFRKMLGETYELYVIRNPSLSSTQPSFTYFPHLTEYAHGDLFTPHPSPQKPALWKWTARSDDVIVFLNGEKTNPISMEQHIVAANREIRAAIVVGAQRFQAALLVDLRDGDREMGVKEKAEVVERIWGSVEEANSWAPAHARIAKTHVFFSHPDKRILIAGKGTIQRAGTLALYEAELDALYADAEKMAEKVDGEVIGNVDITDSAAVLDFLKKTVKEVTKWEGFSDTQDFFTLGLDSLQALTLVRKLRGGLGIKEIAVSLVYMNPSVEQLGRAVMEEGLRNRVDGNPGLEEIYRSRVEIFEEFRGKIDGISVVEKGSGMKKDGEVVVLTGSTGALGSYILETLLSHPNTRHIYCLNRSSSPQDLQSSRNKPRHLSTDFDSSLVTFLTTDLSKSSLGLDSAMYAKLVADATLIIHNAWPVNFNMPLSSFRPSLESLVNLINLNTASSASLFFISSISSVMAYQTPSHLTPETTISLAISEKELVTAGNGYAESKYLSELLLSYAAEKFPSSKFGFARVGQIAGPVKKAGLWNKSEWFPSLVLSSLHVGAIPETFNGMLASIDWVPVDLLGEILVELAFKGAQDANLKIFHPVNPHPKPYTEILPSLIAHLSKISGKEIERVSLDKWIERVRKDMEVKAGKGKTLKEGELEEILKVNPAVKLLDFYESLIEAGEKGKSNVLDTRQTEKASEKLRSLEGVKEDWIGKWVGEWVG